MSPVFVGQLRRANDSEACLELFSLDGFHAMRRLRHRQLGAAATQVASAALICLTSLLRKAHCFIRAD